MFLRAYLTQLQRATAEGVPMKGYFQWSTIDNFEWNAGLSGNRFGLVYVDFKTQKRTARRVLPGSARRRGGTRSCETRTRAPTFDNRFGHVRRRRQENRPCSTFPWLSSVL
jgi:hypothetical protein